MERPSPYANRPECDLPRAIRRWVPPGLAAVLAVLLMAIMGMPGCERQPPAPRVILIGIDGADWQNIRPLLAEGRLPNFRRLIEEGAHGPLRSIHPLIAPLTWTSIATGKGPDKHGVLDFTMPDPATGDSIVVTSAVRRSKAFWNILTDFGMDVAVVGWWASWPAEPVQGVMVSDRIGQHAFIPAAETQHDLVYPPEMTSTLLGRIGDPSDIPYEVAREFLHVSPEEYAAAPALEFGNPISHFRQIYQAMANTHAVALQVARSRGPEVLAVSFEGIAPAGQIYMRYAPPPHPGSTPEEQQKFGDTMTAFYDYQDRLMGDLLGLADENTTVIVVSNHGLKRGPQRPRGKSHAVDYTTAAAWHRLDGILLMMGPQVRAKRNADDPPAVFSGATIFDVVPTLLALLGVPVGEDMEGAVRSEMLTPIEVATIPSHEDDAWRQNRLAARAGPSAIDQGSSARLGVPGDSRTGNDGETLTLQGRSNLATYYIFREKYEEAARQLRALIDLAPHWPDPYYDMGLVYLRQSVHPKARSMFEKVLELDPGQNTARMNLAFIHRELGNRHGALSILQEAVEWDPQHVGAWMNLGMLYGEARQFDQAIDSFEKVLELDPNNHQAFAQLAMSYEQISDIEQAIEYWEQALRAQPDDRRARDRLNAARQRIAPQE
jgi:Flp pilus assembly protein TadD